MPCRINALLVQLQSVPTLLVLNRYENRNCSFCRLVIGTLIRSQRANEFSFDSFERSETAPRIAKQSQSKSETSLAVNIYHQNSVRR